MPETEFDRESAVVAGLYERLDALRSQAASRLAAVRAQPVGGNHQARSERDAFARLFEDRMLALRDVDDRLVFGRLQREGTDGIHYIGRVGMRDDEQRSLLLDWRAPQAAPFYQATAANPLGVQVRRHLALRGRELTRIDDEVFDGAMLDGAGDAAEVQGEGALLAAVTAQRTGHMHDIVATIQAEQDRIIRSELRGALVVQGGPGTGKTAVALHRAAYLLYTHRDRLGSAGILVVGPSPVFLGYIGSVLPSLGESGVVLRSLGELFPGVVATAEDEPVVAALKGEAVMAELIRRAVRSRQRMPETEQVVDVNGERLTVPAGVIAEATRRAQASGKRYNDARAQFVGYALDALTELLASRLRAGNETLDDDDLRALREDIRTSYDARVVLNTAWLPLTPEKLLRDLYARPQWLAELTPNWPPERRALLRRDREAAFTVSDVPLLDEAAELLGELPAAARPGEAERRRQHRRDLDNARHAIANAGAEGIVSADRLVERFDVRAETTTTAERALADRTWTYGHVVVDEAQELSPMQWRLLVRRCPLRSFTIVGDIAQGAVEHGATVLSERRGAAEHGGMGLDWRRALGPVFGDRLRIETLTVNYRTPAQIMSEAERVAAEHGLPVTPSRSVREGEWPIVTLPAHSAVQLPAVVVDAVRRVREEGPSGTLAVIAPPSALAAMAAALEGAFGVDVAAGERALDHAISLLTPREAKGLEFDSVVLAAPERMLSESPRGASDLYVAMTRPTQRLVHVTFS